MDYPGGEKKDFKNREQPIFGAEVFGGQPEQNVEISSEAIKPSENIESQDDSMVEMSMPPGMSVENPQEQAIAAAEEVEKKEHKNAKTWIEEVKENIERDGDDPRKLQEDWAKNANDFLSESYSRRWGDRN